MRLSRQTEGIMPVGATLHAQVNRASFIGDKQKKLARTLYFSIFGENRRQILKAQRVKREKKTLFVIHVASMGICYCLLIGIIKLFFFLIFKRPFTNA